MSTAEIATIDPKATALAKPAATQEPQLFAGFEGAAMAPFDDKAREVLGAPVDPRDVEIRPDGIVYMSGVWYRRQLIRAFGAGSWALLPRSQPRAMGDVVIYHGALVVLGRFVAEAFGECSTRGGMTYASALEGARTDCLSRCCKDLGMATELWDKTWIAGWKRDCAHMAGTDRNGKPTWTKNDGSEHQQAPLFQGKASAPADVAAARAALSGDAATNLSADERGEVIVGAALGKPARADTVKHSNVFASDVKVARLTALASAAGTLCNGGCAIEVQQYSKRAGATVAKARLCTLHTQLAAFKGPGGEPCKTPNELSEEQADNLIARYEAKLARQEQRSADVPVLDIAPAKEPVVSLDDVFQETFDKDDEEETWLHGLFGVRHRRELDATDATTALGLLLAMKMGEEKYSDALEKARAMGLLR